MEVLQISSGGEGLRADLEIWRLQALNGFSQSYYCWKKIMYSNFYNVSGGR
jgi:hypothetical protein